MNEEKNYSLGDSIDLEFDLFKDKAKTIAWDLSDYEIRFELFQLSPILKIRKATANVTGGTDEQIKLNDSQSNRFTIYILESETDIFESGTYSFEIEIYNPISKERVTIASDRINLINDRIEWNSITD